MLFKIFWEGCTHYNWNSKENGTCYLKEGQIKILDSKYNANYDTICGLVSG